MSVPRAVTREWKTSSGRCAAWLKAKQETPAESPCPTGKEEKKLHLFPWSTQDCESKQAKVDSISAPTASNEESRKQAALYSMFLARVTLVSQSLPCEDGELQMLNALSFVPHSSQRACFCLWVNCFPVCYHNQLKGLVMGNHNYLCTILTLVSLT